MVLRYNLWTLCVLYLVCCQTTPTEGREYRPRQPPHVAATQIRASQRPTPEAYNSMRDMFFRYEESKFFGADIHLTQKELTANQMIMDVKTKEYENGLITPHLFTPSQHFFSVLDEIRESPLFKYIAKMPKGGVLHAHDTALCSTDFLIKLTYRENLWAQHCDGIKEITGMKFSKTQPKTEVRANCSWELLKKIRDQYGANKVDEYLAQHLTMYPTEKFLDNNVAWQQFMGIFGLLDGLLMYAPVWADYYYNALEEFYADGVQYLEFRTTLPTVS